MDLLKLLVLTLQLLLVDPVALHLHFCALVIQVMHSAVNLRVEVVVVLEEFELTRGVSAEWSGGGEWCGLEGLNVLMRVTVNHAIYKGVFTVFELDILRRLHFAIREVDVERDIVGSLI